MSIPAPSSEASAPRAEPRPLATRLARLEPPGRIPGVDLARGLAVVGMLAAHLVLTGDPTLTDPATWNGIVEGRSSILFATLAGVSLALTTDPGPGSPRRIRAGATPLLLARGAVIWVLGVILVATLVPVHVILPAYGILFVLAVGLLRLSTRALCALAGTVAILGPFVVMASEHARPADSAVLTALEGLVGWHYPVVVWTAFLAAGIVAGRALRRDAVRAAARLLGIGALLTAIGYGLIGPLGDPAWWSLREDPAAGDATTWMLAALSSTAHSSGVGEAIGSGGFALAVIGLCTLVCRTPVRHALWPVRAMGSMPLTAYCTQLLVWAGWNAAVYVRDGTPPWEDPFSWHDPFWPLTLGILALCVLWALLRGRGPLEALVAVLSRTLVRTGRWVLTGRDAGLSRPGTRR